MLIHHHHPSIRIFQEKIFRAELTNCDHLLSELHLASKKSKGFTAWRHLEASIINSGPAPCAWRPVSNGTISNNGTAKEPCRYSMAHGEKNMGIWKCFRFFSGGQNAHRISRCKLVKSFLVKWRRRRASSLLCCYRIWIWNCQLSSCQDYFHLFQPDSLNPCQDDFSIKSW